MAMMASAARALILQGGEGLLLDKPLPCMLPAPPCRVSQDISTSHALMAKMFRSDWICQKEWRRGAVQQPLVWQSNSSLAPRPPLLTYRWCFTMKVETCTTPSYPLQVPLLCP